MDGRIDLNDVPFIGIFSVSAATNLGFFELPLPFFSLSDALFTLGQGEGQLAISIATIGSLISLAFAFYTNRLDRSQFSGIEYWIVIATVGLVLASPFKIIINTIMMNDTAAFVGWVVQSTGILALSYSG